jgi:hypothetical protein
MKLKVPTKLDLCGYVLTIKYMEDIQLDGNELEGMFSEHDHSISISTTSHDTIDQVYSTIIHEALHAVFRRSGLTPMMEVVSPAFEEAIVRSIENNLRTAITLDRKAWLTTKMVDFTFDSHTEV